METDPLVGVETSERSSCIGTSENSRIWLNTKDTVGVAFAIVVWLIFIFTFGTTLYIIFEGELGYSNGAAIILLTILSIWSHFRTMVCDPGAVPANAHPLPSEISKGSLIPCCGQCNSYKPPNAHHCRISGRCISRMDHFCPWMNNAIGLKNQKNFIQFLVYSDIAAIYMYILLAVHLLFCDDFNCTPFTGTSLILVRILIVILFAGIIFLSSMIGIQIYGLRTGYGTIDRMKMSPNVVYESHPVPFRHVFGTSYLSYIFPIDPVFDPLDQDEIFQYQIKSEPFVFC